MNFDEDNFVENQQKEDALFGALLDSVDLIDDIYGQYQNKISELDQQLLQLEKSIQVCEKMSLVKNQTIQKIDESLQRIQHSSQISQHLAKYQSQYELNSEMKAALSNPLNDKFDAHFDELMVVINEPNFPTLQWWALEMLFRIRKKNEVYYLNLTYITIRLNNELGLHPHQYTP
ncbi:Conserved_hypothetical protein [Hexamita inflata]|uniref:Uncharacterized protein n=1 Tax=Hexamita inflata TaxID=28002 RepID=A0AA86PHF7_9EUKA|nr:Conserved hypothetical protein [Hexamita inflata]